MKVYTYVDKFPQFGEGTSDVLRYVHEHYKYPKSSLTQFTFNIQFVVDVDGSVVGERIMNKKNEDVTEAEYSLLQIFRSMPAWKPGVCGGKEVPVLMSLPIRINPR